MRAGLIAVCLAGLLAVAPVAFLAASPALSADAAPAVQVTGETGGPHQILLYGRPFGPPDTEPWSLSVDTAYPSAQAPKWVVLAYGDGGNACEGSYRVLDLSGAVPVLSPAVGTCGAMTLLATDSQLIFDFGTEVWTYTAAAGLQQSPPLSPPDQVRAGVEAYGRGDYETALRLLWPLRLSPLPEAPFHAGLMALSGKGMPADPAQALTLFTLAAELRYAPAQVRLGQMIADGRGGPVADPATAARWFLLAAEQGDPTGQYALGQSLLDGSAGRTDPAAALPWLLLAAQALPQPDLRTVAQTAAAQAEARIPPAQAALIRRDLPLWRPKTAPLFSGPADLRAWLDRHPHDRVRGHILLDVPDLKHRLTAVLGADTVAALRPMTVAEPVTEQNSWLLFGGCTPHACNTGHFAVVVNLVSYDVWACARLENPDADTDTLLWGSPDRPAQPRPQPPEDDDLCAVPTGPDGLKAFLKAAEGE